jgi:Flp pilus assembly protein TadG
MNLSSFRSNECGAAMVEFAIVLPLLLLLVCGVIDLGRLLYAYDNLTSAVREGARLAAVQQDPTLAASQAAVRSRVQQWNFPGKRGTPTVSVTPNAALPNTQFVTVTVTAYAFNWITPLPAFAGLNNVAIWPSAAFRWEGAPGP